MFNGQDRLIVLFFNFSNLSFSVDCLMAVISQTVLCLWTVTRHPVQAIPRATRKIYEPYCNIITVHMIERIFMILFFQLDEHVLCAFFFNVVVLRRYTHVCVRYAVIHQMAEKNK